MASTSRPPCSAGANGIDEGDAGGHPARAVAVRRKRGGTMPLRAMNGVRRALPSLQTWLSSWRRRSSVSGGQPRRALFDPRKLDRRHRYANEAVIRGLCDNAYLGDDQLLCRVLGRYKMMVDARDAGVSPHLLLDGYWEMWLTEALAGTVRRGMTVVDIGANLGYFTLLMADLVGASGKVHAFEPNARLTRHLRQSVTLNGFDGRVTVHEQALADAEAMARLVVPADEPKNGYLLPWAQGDAEAPLHTRRFDSYPDLLAADVVKIDADTSEQRIWQGMDALLQQGRPLTVFLEFAADRYANAAAFVDDILQHGFRLAHLTLDDGIQPITKAGVLAERGDQDVMLVLTR